MICAILDQDQFPQVSRPSFAALSLCVSIGFYALIDCFMLNLISTDLVIIPEPQSIRSFSDILSRNVTVLFFKGMTEEQIYSESKEGTQEYEIMKNVYSYGGIGGGMMKEIGRGMMKQEYVFLIRDWVPKVFANTGILGMKDKRIRLFLAEEEMGRKFLMAFMYNDDQITNQFRTFIHRT